LPCSTNLGQALGEEEDHLSGDNAAWLSGAMDTRSLAKILRFIKVNSEGGNMRCA
jgi:hypothetical protein